MADFIVNTDGGSRGNPGPAGFGAVIRNGDSEEIYIEAAGFFDKATNNVAEYHGVLLALETIADINPDATVLLRADSNLAVKQLSGQWKIKDPNLAKIAARIKEALPPKNVTYQWVRREFNKDADRLANEAMDARESIWRVREDRAPRIAASAGGGVANRSGGQTGGSGSGGVGLSSDGPSLFDALDEGGPHGSSHPVEAEGGAGNGQETEIALICDASAAVEWPSIDDALDFFDATEEDCVRYACDRDICTAIAAAGGFRQLQTRAVFAIAPSTKTVFRIGPRGIAISGVAIPLDAH